MSSMFLSPEWIQALRSELEASSDLAAAAAAWPFGPVLLVVDADGEHITEPAGVLLDLREGRLADVRLAGPAADRTPTAFGGSITRWKAVADGQLGVLDGVLQARLAFRGDLPSVARHATLFSAIAAALGSTATTWQSDEVPASDPVAAKA